MNFLVPLDALMTTASSMFSEFFFFLRKRSTILSYLRSVIGPVFFVNEGKVFNNLECD